MKALFFVARCLAALHLLDKGSVRHCYVAALSEMASLGRRDAHMRSRGEVERLVNDWCFWEARYVAYGYRPASLEDMQDALKHHRNFHEAAWHVRLEKSDQPIRYAPRYRQNFLEGTLP